MSSNAWLNAHHATYGVPLSGLQRAGSEIIPDSEEERIRHRRKEFNVPSKVAEVIEISSESEDESEVGPNTRCTVITMSPTKPAAALPGSAQRSSGKKAFKSFRRIISSSDEESEVEILEVRTMSGIDTTIAVQNTLKGKGPLKQDNSSPTSVLSENDFFKPREKEGIIVLDEPRSSHKPLLIKKGTPSTTSRKPKFPGVGIPDSSISTAAPSGLSEEVVSTPTTRQSAQKAPRTPRTNSKKAQEKEKRDRLHAYAQQLFTDLNATVFDDQLPTSTQLIWNTRLLRTAGRAKFHRTREGAETTEIELADKILDCEERIRHTLSHEMCHLATWVINQKLDEHHGPLFKHWANLVMNKHPEIHVSVKHDYEISYPFQWKCQKCEKIYGRFSKSIKPEECVCGVCKTGRLIALFTTKKRTKATPNISRLAASKPQDSPRAVTANDMFDEVPTESGSEGDVVDMLTRSFAATSLTLYQ
ncbi:SprT-like family-domain-containing protein [Crepidotus variabilis]|uniref:SprT-like family-domain-containing protein n=1 Tax=Crepidotus variabilis TaxID=179855 RepID=A0A9P6JWY8_9AGAR|nr:SprT-like family-domain-containing protein [Crepidotus variabilis]